MSDRYEIYRAEFTQIAPCAAICILGKRRTGKTFWTQYLTQSLNISIDRFMVQCGNKDNAAEWKHIVHPAYVMLKNLARLQVVMDYQDRKVSYYTENKLPIPRKYRLCIIIDDCGSDKSYMHSAIMRDLLANGRHYGITVVILCQYLNQMHSENRDNLDYLGMLYTANQRNIKKVYDEYANITDFRIFKCLLKASTKDKGMLWIDNTKNSGDIADSLFFEKIPINFEFQSIGSTRVRTYGTSHFFDPSTNKLQNSKRLRGSESDISDEDDTMDDYFEDPCILKNASQLMSNKFTFTDKRGSVVVCKRMEKEKIE